MLPIKLSTESQREQVISHLLSFDADDLRLRFGYTPTEYIIRKYVEDSWGKSGNRWFGIYSPEADGVIATLHVALMNDDQAEFGFTVDSRFRNRGFGSELFSRGVTWAKALSVKKVFMHCLSENAAVRKIAKKNEMHVITLDGDEAEADLALPRDFSAPWADLMLDRIAIYDMLFVNQQKLLNNINFYRITK